jgi:hypothetical protein
VTSGVGQQSGSLLDLSVGLGTELVRGVRHVGRLLGPGLQAVVERPLPAVLRRRVPGVQALSGLGRHEREVVVPAATRAVSALAVSVVYALVERLDLTRLVRENVDLDALAETIDVDAVADRIDLLGLAEFVVDGIDLPEIIRESTQGVTSDAVRGLRLQGAEADKAVARVVDRVLLRHRPRQVQGPNGAGPAGSEPWAQPSPP